MIDVGSHIGLVALPAASVLGEKGRVVAFEPSVVNRGFLERHVAMNGLTPRVCIEPLLVGRSESAGVPLFELAEPSGKNTVAGAILGDQAGRVLVAQTAIDTYCERHGLAPEVIKIDVEGAELDVLEGARGVMLRDRPTVFLSVHPRQIGALGRTTDELLAIIESCGYVCRHIDGSAVQSFALREYRLLPRELDLHSQ